MQYSSRQANICCARFELLSGLLLKNQVLWDVTLCHWVNTSQPFYGLYCLRLQGYAFFLDCLSLKKKAVRYFETSVTIYQTHLEIEFSYSDVY
jgi:hypothetical protein